MHEVKTLDGKLQRELCRFPEVCDWENLWASTRNHLVGGVKGFNNRALFVNRSRNEKLIILYFLMIVLIYNKKLTLIITIKVTQSSAICSEIINATDGQQDGRLTDEDEYQFPSSADIVKQLH